MAKQTKTTKRTRKKPTPIPCPFCGETKEIAVLPVYGTTHYYTTCLICHGKGGLGRNEEDAIRKWNRREQPKISETEEQK